MINKIKSLDIRTVFLAVLFFILGFIFFYQLGLRPLLDYDESIYAQVAREQLEQPSTAFTWKGNISLYRNQLWFEKPPLMLWLIESAFFVFGINEFAARFWVAVFAFATIILTFFVVKKTFKSVPAAMLATSVYLISFQYLYFAGVLQFDIPAAFFILLALFTFQQSWQRPKFLYFFWISLALGVMVKSVIGLLPLLIVGVFQLIILDFKLFKSKEFWGGASIFALIVLPWHILQSILYGKLFWQQYLFYHLLGRFNTTLENNGGNFWYYWQILVQHKLLGALSAVSFLFFLSQIRKREYLFYLVSVAVIFVFFSLSKTKLPAYFLVAYPVLAIIGGVFLNKLIERLFVLNKIIGKILATAIILSFLFFGFRYSVYKWGINKNPELLDSKSLGIFLKENYSEYPLYYFSLIGTKPSMIFYSNRIIFRLSEESPNRPSSGYILVQLATKSQDSLTLNSKVIFQNNNYVAYLIE